MKIKKNNQNDMIKDKILQYKNKIWMIILLLTAVCNLFYFNLFSKITSEYLYKYINEVLIFFRGGKNFIEVLKVIGLAVGGYLVFWQTRIANKRFKISQDQISITLKGQHQQRFIDGINLLGNEKEATRIGAIYSLHHLAKDDKEYSSPVYDILCSYIRDTTIKEEYKLKYCKNPSSEIQTICSLLFQVQPDKEIYSELQTNLSGSYLCGIDLSNSKLINTNFSDATLDYATIDNSDCSKSIFKNTSIKNSYISSILYYTSFIDSHFQNTMFSGSDIIGAGIRNCMFMGAILDNAKMDTCSIDSSNFNACKGFGNLHSVHIHGCSFIGAEIRGVVFTCVSIIQTDFSCSMLSDSWFKASYIRECKFNNAVLGVIHIQGTNITNSEFRSVRYNDANGPFIKDEQTNSLSSFFDISGFGYEEYKSEIIMLNLSSLDQATKKRIKDDLDKRIYQETRMSNINEQIINQSEIDIIRHNFAKEMNDHQIVHSWKCYI